MTNQTFALDSGNVITSSGNFATNLFTSVACNVLKVMLSQNLISSTVSQGQELLGDVKALILIWN